MEGNVYQEAVELVNRHYLLRYDVLGGYMDAYHYKMYNSTLPDSAIDAYDDEQWANACPDPVNPAERPQHGYILRYPEGRDMRYMFFFPEKLEDLTKVIEYLYFYMASDDLRPCAFAIW